MARAVSLRRRTITTAAAWLIDKLKGELGCFNEAAPDGLPDVTRAART